MPRSVPAFPSNMKSCRLVVLLACALIFLCIAEALVVKKMAVVKRPLTFHHNHQQPHHYGQLSTRRRNVCTSVTATTTSTSFSTSNKSESGECYYKRIDGSWKPRKELSRLRVGERLFATRLPECDLLEGKTGPKLFLECGVGRKTKGNWKIVNGMLRIPGKKGMKPSVVRKKVKNIPSDSLIEVYVSKIRLEHDSFEVCLNREDALSRYKEQKVSASKFTPGQLLSGVVRDVLPYGVFVDIGASRKGLIHITNVAKSRDCYINKEEGLKSAGLARGSHVRVVVLNNEKKRLEFDLYEAEKAPIAEESLDETAIGFSEGDEEALAWGAYNDERTDEISAEEADMWAAYAAYENSAEDEENDYYDEDEEIEDALGIGSY
ncbi:hypothetical protein ACHAXM_005840 [Skeletonema potamos]